MVFESRDDENYHDQVADCSSGPDTTSTAAFPIGAGSDSISRIPQRIFAVVAPSIVKFTSYQALVEWLRQRDDDLLTTLCEETWGVSKIDLTNEFLLGQPHATTDNYQNQILPPVNELFQKDDCDIQSQVSDYFMPCNKLM
ncbi:hypothetical protein PF007_g899 [Phytophthora fragariae]|uniref:Uncharacterized protein n=1 Tax=Phytophthora fragariae TaxID=53985 RepID=A0A6A3FPY7_9STRA|nr:hypothetical protein PF009_g3080 [Phytophthora fragariae]KAE9139704.1 hypothetical protein PF007_g899 [Phytophthora fragariae]